MRTFFTIIAACVLAVVLGSVASAHVGPTFYAQKVDCQTITIDEIGDDPGWNSSVFSDFVLLPGMASHVDESGGERTSTWGAIKAAFKQ